MQSAYRVRTVDGLAEWDDYFQIVDRPHFTQASAYGEAKRQAGRWHLSRLVFEHGQTPLAICQVLEWRVAGLRVAARINRGPLFLEAEPSFDTKANVLFLLRRQWQYLYGGVLLFAPSLAASDEHRALLLALGFKDRRIGGWCSSLIDLASDDETLRRNLSSTWRNRLRASFNAGLELDVSQRYEDIAWMLDRHIENMQQKNFRGPGRLFLYALHAHNPKDVVVLRALHEGEAIAGVLLMRFGNAAEYYVGWFGEAGRKRNCGNFLYWHAALQMRLAGCRWFDLGGYGIADRYGHFKQNMHGAPYRLIGEWLAY